MATSVHPLAIVEEGAQLGQDVIVEAFALIGKSAVVGDATIIRHHATVEGKATLGKNNEVYPYALIGGLTHDLKYIGGEPELVVGDNNIFREYVTAHVATDSQDCTEIGSDNVFLSYSHIAHDCKVGNHLVMSSQSALGGHVEVDDHVTIGWGVGVHQFCRLGRHCMISACSKLVQDVPPFMLADGSPAEVRSINKVGMERSGFAKTDLDVAKGVFKVLYRGDLNRRQAVKHLQNGSNLANEKITQEIIQFTEKSNRGLA